MVEAASSAVPTKTRPHIVRTVRLPRPLRVRIPPFQAQSPHRFCNAKTKPRNRKQSKTPNSQRRPQSNRESTKAIRCTRPSTPDSNMPCRGGPGRPLPCIAVNQTENPDCPAAAAKVAAGSPATAGCGGGPIAAGDVADEKATAFSAVGKAFDRSSPGPRPLFALPGLFLFFFSMPAKILKL